MTVGKRSGVTQANGYFTLQINLALQMHAYVFYLNI